VTSTLTQQQQQAATDDSSSKSAEGKAAQHVFSALIYLRKLCSHPLLALDWSVPAHREACQQVLGSAAAASQAAAETALRAIEHAPKLLALQDILVQCGLVSADAALGGSGNAGRGNASAAAAREADELAEGSSDSGHRLLVFAQLKGMLDLVESCLLRPLGVSSLRLDGSVDAGSRFGVVQRFNSDPTIQVRRTVSLAALIKWLGCYMPCMRLDCATWLADLPGWLSVITDEQVCARSLPVCL
jgi:TATA-binding protein-associated factor